MGVPRVVDLVVEGHLLAVGADKVDAFGLAEGRVRAAYFVGDGWGGFASGKNDGFLGDLPAKVVGEFPRTGGVGDFGELTFGVVFVGDGCAVGGFRVQELGGCFVV